MGPPFPLPGYVRAIQAGDASLAGTPDG